MGWSDIPPVIGWLMWILVPLHLFGMGGWLCAGIQFAGLAALVVAGVRWKRVAGHRVWFFCLGYPLVVFATNAWVMLDEVFR
jgi:hypothetical protein